MPLHLLQCSLNLRLALIWVEVGNGGLERDKLLNGNSAKRPARRRVVTHLLEPVKAKVALNGFNGGRKVVSVRSLLVAQPRTNVAG